MEASVAVIGLGRVGLPLALSFADRGLTVIGVERRAGRARPARRRARCRSTRPAPRSCSSASWTRAARADARRPGRRARADHIVLTLGTPSHVHIEIDISHDPRRDRRPAAGAARGPLADPPLDGRARHHRVGGRLHRAAARLPRRRGPVRLARAGADRREPLPGGDRDAAVHRRRRRRGLGRQGGRAVRGLRHGDRPDHAGAGRAGEDLDQHPPLRASSRSPTC